MHRTMLAAFLLVLGGCASLTDAQCSGGPADWEWLGQYDAIQGDQPWIEAYAQVCRPHEVNEQAYLEGWQIGHAEFERRVNGMN
jgi:hypothetical protein